MNTDLWEPGMQLDGRLRPGFYQADLSFIKYGSFRTDTLLLDYICPIKYMRSA